MSLNFPNGLFVGPMSAVLILLSKYTEVNYNEIQTASDFHIDLAKARNLKQLAERIESSLHYGSPFKFY